MSSDVTAGIERCAMVLASLLKRSWPRQRDVSATDCAIPEHAFRGAVLELSDGGLITYEAMEQCTEGHTLLVSAGLTRRGAAHLSEATA